MNLDKIFSICKAAKRFVVFKQNPKTQWIGDGIATYIVTHSPKLTPEYLTASAALKPHEVENTIFKNSDFPEMLEAADKSDNEIFIVPSEISINFFDGEYTPVFTSEGVRFIKSIYLKPFDKEEYELYERHTDDGKMYFVIKIGMFVNAFIMAQSNYLDTETVTHFEKLYKRMEYARSILEQKIEEAE